MILLLKPKMHFILQKQITIMSLLMSLWSCKKDKPDPPAPNVVRQELTVVEANSNIPIPGTTVIASFISVLGLGGVVDSAVTNDSGKVIFSTKSGVNSFHVQADKYWPASYLILSPDAGNLELTPIATLKVHITKVSQTQYPLGSLINLMAFAKGCNGCAPELHQLAPPRDRIVYIKGGGGGSSSHLEWKVDTTNRNSPVPWNITAAIVINRSDTAEFSIEY